MRKMIKAHVNDAKVASNIAKALISRGCTTEVRISDVTLFKLASDSTEIEEHSVKEVVVFVGENSVSDCVEVFEGNGVYHGIQIYKEEGRD